MDHRLGGERPDHALGLGQHHPAPEDEQHGGRDQLAEEDLLAPLLERLDLHLALGRGDQGLEVGHPGHGLGLPVAEGATGGVGHQRLVVGDGEPDRHPGTLVEVGALAGQLAQLGHHLGHEVGDLDAHIGTRPQPGRRRGRSGREDRPRPRRSQLGGGVRRVVGADLGAEAVLQGGDDPTAVGVVLGVGRGHQHDVEGQADPVAADLHVPLLEHVEQADLDALGQVGQLVDGEDAPVEPGHQPVVDGQLVGQVPALGHPDGIHLADEVGDGGVRRGQLLAVAVAPVHPRHRQVVTGLGQEILGEAGDGMVRIVVDLRVGHDGQPLVEQPDQGPDDPRLGLAPLAQEDDVVPGQDGVLELGQDRVLEAQHPGDQGLTPGDAPRGVAPDLLGHRDRLPSRVPQPAEGGDVGRRGRPHRKVERCVVGVRVGRRLRRGHGPSLRGTIPPWCVVTRPADAGGRSWGEPRARPDARAPRTRNRGPDQRSFARRPRGWKDDGPSATRATGPARIVAGKRPDQGEKT